MPVPFTCQRVRIDNVMCSKASKCFVMGVAELASAVYARGETFCTPCSEAVRDKEDAEGRVSMILTIAEVEAMMQEETQAQAIPPVATLHELQAHFQAASVDTPKVEEVPTSETAAQADVSQEVQPKSEVPKVDEPAVPSNKAAMLAVLRAEVAKARAEIAQTQQLLESMASLPDFAKQGLLNAIKAQEKVIAAHEKQASKLLEPPVKYYASPEMVKLRHVIFNGGIEALQALDAAMASGLLGKKSAPKKAETIATSETQGAVVAKATNVVQARKDNEERNAKVERMLDQGYKATYICNELGLSAGTVAGITHRYNLRKQNAA